MAAGVLHFGDGTPKLQRGTGALQSHGSGPDSRSSQVEETVFMLGLHELYGTQVVL